MTDMQPDPLSTAHVDDLGQSGESGITVKGGIMWEEFW